uniref:Reverse transcriptase N-terminal domain-containing protein n=1 Tax=Centroceras clavulatum TaxID=159503 RepID=A0A4D6WRY0_9FLOR|nr:hypothetical protein [Centroceras clavulatum]
MTKYCHIHKNSRWDFLPWQTINTRVILIQKKIFEASRRYNLEMLSKAQNYLINSNEAKLIAINIILYKVNEYYKFYNNEKYSYTDTDKFYILRNLFNEKEDLKIKAKFIIEKVKEYIIYLCLQPEWKARLINYTENTKLKDNKIKFEKNTQINCISANKFLKFNLLKKNLTKTPYINQYLKYWVRNRFLLNSSCPIFKDLIYLLKQIYISQGYWSYIKLMKYSYLFSSKNFCYLSRQNLYPIKLIKLFEFNYSKQDYIIKKFLNKVKLKFYKKDNINRLRLYKNFNWLLIIKIIIKKLHKHYCLYKKLLNSLYVKSITIEINHLLLYLKLNQDYYLVKNFRSYIIVNLYNLLSKKITLQFLFLYLFKINR